MGKDIPARGDRLCKPEKWERTIFGQDEESTLDYKAVLSDKEKTQEF